MSKKAELTQGCDVFLFWDKDSESIFIYGEKQDLDPVLQNIALLISNQTVVNKHLNVSPIIARFYKHKNEKKWKTMFPSANVSHDSDGFVISGIEKDATECLLKLKSDFEEFEKKLVEDRIVVQKSLFE